MNSFTGFYNKNKKNILIIFSSIILIIGIINIYYVTNVNITSNDECLWITNKNNDTTDVVLFDLVKENGVTWNAGIRNGDIFLEIEKQTVINPNVAQRILNSIQRGEYALYKIQRGDEIFETKVEVKKLINFNQLGFSLLSFIWFFVGFIILMAKPDGKIQKKFYLVGLLSIISLMSVYLVGKPAKDFNTLLIIIDFLFIIGVIGLPFVLMDFFFTYPKESSFYKRKWIKKLIFLLPIIFIVIVLTLKIFVLNYIIAFTALLPLYQYIFNFLMIFGFITGGVSLVINYFSFKDKSERKKYSLIVLAYVLGISVMLFTIFVSPIVTDSIFNSPEWYMPIAFVFIIPVAFGYSIFKYQLMDLSIVVKNTITYGTATLSLAIIYFGIIYLVGQTLSQVIGTEYQGYIAGIIFIIFAAVFQSTKNRFQDYITMKIYPEQFAHQKVLIKFSNDITTVVGFDNILDMMKDTYVNTLKIDKFGIIIKTDEDESYKLIKKVGIKSNNFDLPVNLNLVKKILYEKKQFDKVPVIDNSEFEKVLPEIVNELIKEDIYTIIPLVIKSKIIGLLLFGLKHAGSKFEGKDLELLTASANQAAIAIENARLYESEAEKLKIQKELQLARKIQENLLPKCIPDMNNLDICGIMKPAMMVGGDYFDLITVSNNKLFVIVGDVSGKGLSAALYMTKLQTMVSMLCTDKITPREVLIELNKKIYGVMEKKSFITISIALFDTEERTVRISRAGHMPVILVKNGAIVNYKSPGIGVGLDSGKIFEETLVEEVINLEKGQIYSFYSDGVVEEMNEHNDLYGTENYSVTIQNNQSKQSSEIMEEVFTSLKTFRGKREQSDDITVVIVKVTD